MKERAEFATKIGVIAATVGSTVGLGNIWRFPYEAGSHGGGAFIIIYIACVLLVGIPVMLSEFVIGRSTHRNSRGALKELLPNGKWHWISYLGIVASMMILSFYSVVAGWTIEYLYISIAGGLSHHSMAEYSAMFSAVSESPWRSLFWTLLFLIFNFAIILRGVQKGIEKISNVMMPLLFIILIVFCVNSLLLPEASKGIKFLFNPDFSSITPTVVIDAMGQAFFSLSLGLGCLLTYASYYSNDTPLVRSATVISLLDTAVAILASIVIFPAVFSFGMQPEAGPKLVFQVLPDIFQRMQGGYFWSIAFFILLFFAAITSTISMSETAITFFIEEYNMSRRKATAINAIVAIAFGSVCALSFGVLKDFTLFGMTVFDLFNYVSSNILLPIGGLFFAIMVGWLINKKIVNDEFTNNGTRHITMARPIIFCIRYISPIAIALIFLYGLGFFNFIK
ncbi:MAG: sodium-dependent transporter [Muribaculaceae bacterium]|jgi:NSS family neurotransmitter:Na+ symporter|nr:sodium-dependent transporter [Muribaculaceae bacterium]